MCRVQRAPIGPDGPQIAGSCITAASILYIASIAISALVVNAANYAAANAESAAVASAYRGARVRIHEMLVRAANSRAADPAGVAELQTHERALQVLAEDGADCAERVLGVAVDSGAARSMVVGALTVGLGLYSIFRSAGIFATVQIFAPSV
ncbi:hypothetical protein DFJ74DRAFT_343569 [Hyaloraphidium curvatum]|nr:hypothetical protein DFJ74DRAFT_343569 [Hyaloraphidium curvatum]